MLLLSRTDSVGLPWNLPCRLIASTRLCPSGAWLCMQVGDLGVLLILCSPPRLCSVASIRRRLVLGWLDVALRLTMERVRLMPVFVV